MPKDSYTKHVYDVDLVAIYKSMAELERHSITLTQKQGFIKSLMLNFKTYCLFKGIDFDIHLTEGTNIVVPSTEPFFQYALTMMLLSYELPKLNSFLDYQKRNYKGKDDFIGFIEFLVYENVKTQSPFNNEIRLERIMQWVESNRSEKSKVKTIADSKSEEVSLIWNVENLEGLKNISAQLKLNGYINGKYDFEKVFTQQKQTSWLKQPEFLAHLIYSLYKMNLFKASKGKGYFEISEQYFSYYSDNSDKKLTLKTMSSRVNQEGPKYSKIRRDVKKTIKDYIK